MPASRCTCPSCGTALKFATPLRPGEEVRCPRCAEVFAVPRAEDPVNRRGGRDPDEDFPDEDERDLDEARGDRRRRGRRSGKGPGLPWWLKAILLTGAWSALLVAVPATVAAFLTEDDEQAERLGYVFGQLNCLPWLAVTVLIWILCYWRGPRAEEDVDWPARGRRARGWDERRPRRGRELD